MKISINFFKGLEDRDDDRSWSGTAPKILGGSRVRLGNRE